MKTFLALGAILALAGLNVYQYATRPHTPGRRAQAQQTVERFHQMFYTSPATWIENRWLGVLTHQNPNDVWIHQEIIVETKPDFIIETGTFHGGSAALWATILQQVNPQGKVITIDVHDLAGEARKLPIMQERVIFLRGSSTDPKTLAQVEAWVEGKRVLVILDSLHTRDHVLQELRCYSRFVQKGGYLIVQDTNVNGHPVRDDHGPGPMEAVEDFLRENDQFVADRTRERLMLTMHPKGYLKRVLDTVR
jgi:cephalosporin hydroxylase